VEIAEGPLESPRCVLRGGPRDWNEGCPVHERWARARSAFAAELAATTFAELAEIDRRLQRGEVRWRSPLHLEAVERNGVRD
jgi:DNA-binding IscR family transcriptional regulator